ncbi:MAG TPA: WYL domain-containing protein [Candidatus Angelobacter sp.]|nr:WYL domain-containing protein [Candidatus Angelobacter sp.]
MSRPGGAPDTAANRLSRLLALVPWLSAHPGVTVDEAAAHFGITPEQLQADLWLIICTGRPGHMPGDLVDIQFWDEDGRITVVDPQTLERPLRLSPDEAAALLVALRVLAQVPGPHDRAALAGATSKLETAAGESLAGADALTVTVDAARDPEVADAVARALAEGRRLHLHYVGSLDERTERDVDPMRLLTLEGRTYLEAWCRRAEAVRTFRLDRIEAAELLDVRAEVPADAAPVELGAGALRPEGTPVMLELAPEVAWIAEENPVDSVADLGEGRLRVVMPVADERWLVRLLLRTGASVTVLDRPDVVERVRAEARAALAAYGTDA